MTDVFLSYKRDDEARAGRLVRALEAQGLQVWWDRGLQAGGSWRAQIETELAAARCVVVLWTAASVGPEGGFVKDEATRGLRRRALVQVLLDRVELPVGFGEEQAIDLVGWGRGLRRSASDPFVLDLAAAIRAKLDGRPAPKPQGPWKRRLHRTTGSISLGLALAAGAFATNAVNLQQHLCTLPLAQPGLSDACGAAGLGGRPSRPERLAWAALPAGDCAALRRFVSDWPSGLHRPEADARLTARSVTRTERWEPKEVRISQYLSEAEAAAVTETRAREQALAAGQRDAEQRCRLYPGGNHRFVGAVAEPGEWRCHREAAGWFCSSQGTAVCRMEARVVTEVERCGGG
jgi:serine/threonine-protein kinase